MRAAALTSLLLLLTLAACSEGDPKAPTPVEPPAQPAVLDGVDLTQPVRVLGTEPFWSVDIEGQTLRYTGVDRPEQTAPNPGPVMTGTVATWTTRTAQGNALEVALMTTECSDGMSDRVFPLTARVKIGDETLQGCAAATEAVMRVGESGPVR